MLGDNYTPQTIEDQDKAVQDETTSEMTQTQYSTQEQAMTTNTIEESPGTASDNETPLSQDEQTTANVEIQTTGSVEIQTTASIEIPTTAQSWLSTNQDEDTTKEANEKSTTTTISNTIPDDWGTGPDDWDWSDEFTTVKTLNKLLWNTLVKEQEKEKPDNYNRKNRIYGEQYSDEEESQDETMQANDIKERKYNIKESTDEPKNERNRTYEDFNESEDYLYDNDIDTSNICNILKIFCIIISDNQSSIKERPYNIKGKEESNNQSKTSLESNNFDDSADEADAQSLSG